MSIISLLSASNEYKFDVKRNSTQVLQKYTKFMLAEYSRRMMGGKGWRPVTAKKFFPMRQNFRFICDCIMNFTLKFRTSLDCCLLNRWCYWPSGILCPLLMIVGPVTVRTDTGIYERVRSLRGDNHPFSNADERSDLWALNRDEMLHQGCQNNCTSVF